MLGNVKYGQFADKMYRTADIDSVYAKKIDQPAPPLVKIRSLLKESV